MSLGEFLGNRLGSLMRGMLSNSIPTNSNLHGVFREVCKEDPVSDSQEGYRRFADTYRLFKAVEERAPLTPTIGASATPFQREEVARFRSYLGKNGGNCPEGPKGPRLPVETLDPVPLPDASLSAGNAKIFFGVAVIVVGAAYAFTRFVPPAFARRALLAV